MTKSVLAVRVDNQTKIKARKLARDAGLSLSDLINWQLKTIVSQGLVDIPTKLNPKFEKQLERIDADIKAGRNLKGPFKTGAELSQALNLDKDS